MHKNATKCNETLNKWCKNKHGASKIMDTLKTYHGSLMSEQETCAMLSYFLPRDWWILHFCFRTRPWNLNLLWSRMLLIGGSNVTLLTINVCYLDLFSSVDCWLLGFHFWTLTRLWNSKLIRFRDAGDGWVLDIRLSEKETCTLLYLFCSLWLLHSWLLFWSPPVKFKLDKVHGSCLRVGLGCQIIWKRNEFYLDLFCTMWLLGFYFQSH
jgi:hypothetical protein